MRLWQYCVY